MKVGIIGSGIMGTCIGYFLSKRALRWKYLRLLQRSAGWLGR